MVVLGADQKVKLYNDPGSVHLIADLAGYYSTGSTGRFTAFSTGVVDIAGFQYGGVRQNRWQPRVGVGQVWGPPLVLPAEDRHYSGIRELFT